MFFMASTSRFVKLLLKYGVLPAFDVFCCLTTVFSLSNVYFII